MPTPNPWWPALAQQLAAAEAAAKGTPKGFSTADTHRTVVATHLERRSLRPTADDKERSELLLEVYLATLLMLGAAVLYSVSQHDWSEAGSAGTGQAVVAQAGAVGWRASRIRLPISPISASVIPNSVADLVAMTATVPAIAKPIEPPRAPTISGDRSIFEAARMRLAA